jgi:nucleoside-diphosphate kinase
MSGHLTLALIKPHIHFKRKVGEVIQRIEDAGFGILLSKLIQLRPEGAEEFYSEHRDKEFFLNLTKVMCSGPLWVLVLSKHDAVEEWRNLIGATNPATATPGTIRHDFGEHENITNNAVHGSADDWAARREINFFFNKEIALASRLNELEKG